LAGFFWPLSFFNVSCRAAQRGADPEIARRYRSEKHRTSNSQSGIAAQGSMFHVRCCTLMGSREQTALKSFFELEAWGFFGVWIWELFAWMSGGFESCKSPAWRIT
jgi:hypothetical protein